MRTLPRGAGPPLAFALLVVVLLAGCAGKGTPGPSTSATTTGIPLPMTGTPSPGPTSANYTVQTACIDATVPAEAPSAGGPVRVVGTFMGPINRTDRLAMLLPGGDAVRGVFDAPAPGGSLQRYLAQRGVASLAIDRAGMGDSHYDGPISLGQSESVLQQIIEAVHKATWHAGDGCTQGPMATKNVVLGGWSLGSVIALHYAEKHEDVAGVLLLGTTLQSLNAKTGAGLVFCGTLHNDPVAGRLRSACPEAVEPMGSCSYQYAYPPVTDPVLVEAYCQKEYAQSDVITIHGFGESVTENRIGLQTMHPVPVDLVMYEFDWAVSNEGFEAQDRADLVSTIGQYCPVTSVTVPATGHGFFMHPGQEVGYQNIVDWMRSLP